MRPQSQDALEVAEVLGNKLRPVYTFAAIMIAVVGAGSSYVWQLSDFITRDAVHEKQQDENLLSIHKRLKEHDEQIARAKERNLDTVKLLINDLAMLRSIQLDMLPRAKKAQARKDFEAQRLNSIDVLVNAQKD